jgi:hypothetical protein
VDGPDSEWEVTALTVSDPGEAQLTISNGGRVRSSTVARVNALGRLTLDGGRLESESPMGLANAGIVEGNGIIEAIFNNNPGGQLRVHGESPLVITGAIANGGLIDIRSGELEVLGATINNLDIDARDGATLRFRGTGLDNNAGAQLAITTGVVDVFGMVDNNAGAEIVVGSTAVAVFHDAVANSGTLFVQPEGKVLILDDLAFTPLSVLSLPLQAEGTGKLDVAGDAQLAGDLHLDLAGAFTPLPGDQFPILSSGGLGGTTFSTVSAGPANGLVFFPIYTATDVTIFTAAAGEKTWGVDADGGASVASNWFGGVAPGGIGDVAAFTTIITADRIVTVDQPLTVGTLKFDDDNNYTLAGPQTLTLQASTNVAATIEVQNRHGNGDHTLAGPVALASDLEVAQQSAGALTISGTVDNSLGRTITKLGPGTLVLGGAQTHGAGAVLNVAAGTVNLNTDAGSNLVRNLAVNSNSTTNFGASQHLAALNIGADATSTLTAGGAKNLVSNSLTIAGGSTPTGRLDLTNNAAIVDYPIGGPSPAATIRSQIIAGRGGPGFGATWTGNGITSSAAAAAVATDPESRSVGYAENSTLPLGPYANFRGQSVDDTSVLIAYTRTGDANLDGIVDDTDVTILSATYDPGVPQPHWALGDFDYNGFVDDADVTLLGAFYDPAATPLISPAPRAGGEVSAVPEPSTFGLLVTLSLVALLAMRHRGLTTAKRVA